MKKLVPVLIFSTSMAVIIACGRQITPDPTTSNLAGHTVIRFRTVGALNFSKYDYAIVFNTCGDGVHSPTTPYPNVFATTFNNYSYSFNIGTAPLTGGSTSATTAFPELIQYHVTAGTSNTLNPQIVQVSPTLTTLEPNSNGQSTEFTLTFDRRQLANPLDISNPCPLFPLPTPGPGSPPGATPDPQATVISQTMWAVNFFTIQASGTGFSGPVILDSLGSGGASDTSYDQAVFDTGTTNSLPVEKQPDVGGPFNGPPTDPAAAIAGGEIDNYQ